MINEKNFEMTDEELDRVGGGSWMATLSDVQSGNKLGIAGLPNLNDAGTLQKLVTEWAQGDQKTWGKAIQTMTDAFASKGITFKYHGKPTEANEYIYNGQAITQKQAWTIMGA